MPALSANVQMNRSDVIARIVRGGAREVGRRADRLGTRMETAIATMIDGDLGPTTNDPRSELIPMRSINWTHRVENPGKFPIDVTLFSPDVTTGSAMAAKFGALNFGSGEHRIKAKNKPWLVFEGTNDWAGQIIKVKEVKHPGTGAGRQWLQRVTKLASRRTI